ncbi:MAG: O-antigen ligase family protein [bacterium]
MSQGLLVNLVLMVGVVAFALLTCLAPSMAVVAGMASIVFAATVRWPDYVPKWGFYAIVGLVPLSAIGGHLPIPVVNSLTKLMFLLAFGWLLIGGILGNRRFVVGPQGLAAMAFAGTSVLAYIYCEKTEATFPVLMRFLNHVLLFLLAVNVLKTKRDIAILFGVIVITCLVSAVGGILSPNLWSHEHGTAGERLAGWTLQDDAPTFGFFLLMGILISFYYLLVTRLAWLRVALLPVIGILVYAMVSTYARSTFIVLVAAVGFTLFKLRKRIPVVFALLCLCVITLAVAPLIPRAFYSRITSIGRQFDSEGRRDPTVQWRIDSARIGFDMFMQSPLMGRGPGNFPEEYLSREFRYDRAYRPKSVVGNTYVSVLYQVGFLGFAILTLLMFMAWRDLRAVKASYTVEGAGVWPPAFLNDAAILLQILLVALLMFSLFGAIEKEKYLWAVLATAAVLARIRREELPPAISAKPVEG